LRAAGPDRRGLRAASPVAAWSELGARGVRDARGTRGMKTRLAVDAARRIRAGVIPFGVSQDRVLGMAGTLAGGARFPSLILVTNGLGGDLVVLEGRARLTAPHARPRPGAAGA
jgi:hypothetical protein